MSTVRTPPPAAPPARPNALPPSDVDAAPVAHLDRVDVLVGGLVRLRLIGATAADRRAVEAQFGPAAPAIHRTSDPEPPAAITVRYRTAVPLEAPLRYLGPGEVGYTSDGLVVLSGRFRRPVRVLYRFDDLAGPFEVVAEHGVGRIPHLVALVNLAVLAAGGVALHASAFADGTAATLATGWSKGGKSEALVAACERGARFVADEWAHLHPDGRVAGIREPVRVWDWHLAQVPALEARLAGSTRRRLRALRWAETGAHRAGTSARVTTAIHRQRFVDVPPDVVAPSGTVEGPIPLGTVLLMTSADVDGVTVHRLPGGEVARRMAASLATERQPLAALLDAHRFAFPGSLPGLDAITALEGERLAALLAGHPAVEVLHPYPVDLQHLGAALLDVGEVVA